MSRRTTAALSSTSNWLTMVDDSPPCHSGEGARQGGWGGAAARRSPSTEPSTPTHPSPSEREGLLAVLSQTTAYLVTSHQLLVTISTHAHCRSRPQTDRLRT